MRYYRNNWDRAKKCNLVSAGTYSTKKSWFCWTKISDVLSPRMLINVTLALSPCDVNASMGLGVAISNRTWPHIESSSKAKSALFKRASSRDVTLRGFRSVRTKGLLGRRFCRIKSQWHGFHHDYNLQHSGQRTTDSRYCSQQLHDAVF